MKEIILASGSPRRKELLTLIGIPFRVIKSSAPEVITRQRPEEIVKELSFQKAKAVADTLPPQDGEVIVLGADTIVWHNHQVLGKPADASQAREMLRSLQGTAHSVFTGVTLLRNNHPEASISFHRETRVHVHAMTEGEISDYIRTGDPFDKAGSYGIQGPFAAFVEGIEGDYQNVVGLPIAAVYQALKQLQEDPSHA